MSAHPNDPNDPMSGRGAMHSRCYALEGRGAMHSNWNRRGGGGVHPDRGQDVHPGEFLFCVLTLFCVLLPPIT